MNRLASHLLACHSFELPDICACFVRSSKSAYRFVVSMLLQCIGTSNNHYVAPDLLFSELCYLNAGEVFLQIDDLLAVQVPASFLEHLVFDVECCDTCSRVLCHCAFDNHWPPESIVHIRNKWRCDVEVCYHFSVGSHVRQLSEPKVGLSQSGNCCTCSGLPRYSQSMAETDSVLITAVETYHVQCVEPDIKSDSCA